MTKMFSNVLVVVLALSFGILLASAGVTTTLLGANLSVGKTSTNSTAKSGNVTAAGTTNKTGGGNMKNATLSGHGTQAAPFAATPNTSKAGNATAGNATAGNATEAGKATVGNVSNAASNATKAAGGALSNLSKAVGGGLKGLGNVISGGKK